MLLRQLVMLVALAQVGLDTCGLVLHLHLQPLQPLHQLPSNYTRMVEYRGPGGGVIRDYSGVEEEYTMHYSAYLVPHLFSGVLARMLGGFPCVTAEHMVEELVQRWREDLLADWGPEEWREEEGVYVIPVIGEEEEVVEVLEVEELVVLQWRRRVEVVSALHHRGNGTTEEEEELEEALHLRREHCGPGAAPMVLELPFLVANLSATLLLFVVSNTVQYPRLHLPWMIFSSVEIVGNFLVAVCFLLVPGPAFLISCVCMAKLCWLRWVWASLVRNQMNQQINSDTSLQVELTVGDLEQEELRRVHRRRVGRIRLGRVFGLA